GVKYGSASTPSPANGGSSAFDQPLSVQRLTKILQPSNAGVLRTNHRSPVRGSNAACDSKAPLAIGAGAQRVASVLTTEGAGFFCEWASCGAAANPSATARRRPPRAMT